MLPYCLSQHDGNNKKMTVYRWRDTLVKKLLTELKFSGYGPKTLLDVGAHLGAFSADFATLFPECRPTLVEPNPHCVEHLKRLPFEVIPVAASHTNGKAQFFLTKEWLQTTGASLYRENTPFFRDESVLTVDVNTARLDDVLPDRAFDFIKIDVQGAELDALIGGERLFRQADYVLIEVSLVEYNVGAALPEDVLGKLAEYGFRQARPVEFHRLKGVMGGALLQIDFLFEREIAKKTQNYAYTSLANRKEVLQFLEDRKKRCADFSVIDIGCAVNPWTASVVTATLDKNTRKITQNSFFGDMNKPRDWEQVLDYVDRHGKFSYSVCTHTLEDLAYPILTLEMLPRIAEAGFISVPSKFVELQRGIEGPYRGFIHHRWIFCTVDGQVILVPKIPLVEYLPLDSEQWANNPENRELQIFWRKGLSYSILNDDYLGPNATAVVDMYRAFLEKN